MCVCLQTTIEPCHHLRTIRRRPGLREVGKYTFILLSYDVLHFLYYNDK